MPYSSSFYAATCLIGIRFLIEFNGNRFFIELILLPRPNSLLSVRLQSVSSALLLVVADARSICFCSV